MKSGVAFALASVLLAFASPQALAAAQLASPEQDRYAKQSVPPSGKALVYVYRLEDGNPNATPGLWLNKRDSGRLESNTYGMWAASPGRLEVRAGKADAAPLSFNCEAGRIYFVQLAVSENGEINLRQVPYGTGRKEMSLARLVLDPALAARVVAPTAKTMPPPPVPVPAQKATPVKKTPAIEKAPKPRRAQDDSEKNDSDVTIIAKVGSFQLASSSQTIVGLSRSFTAAGVAYGLEGEWHLSSGLAFSFELFGHTQDYTTLASAESGDMVVTNVFINAKKYFRPDAVVQPYVGIGFGSAVASLSAGSSGGITGSAGGFALQGMTGVAFRWQRFGLYTEFKYVRSEIEDSVGQSVDVSGTGLFAGMSVHF